MEPAGEYNTGTQIVPEENTLMNSTAIERILRTDVVEHKTKLTVVEGKPLIRKALDRIDLDAIAC